MQFMILRRADPASETGRIANAESALLRATLQPSANAVRLTLGDGEPTVVHGPFSPDEMIAGFGVVEADSKEEVVQWLKRWPEPDAPVEIEIRESGCPGGCAEVHAVPGSNSGKRFAILLRSSDDLENEVPVPQAALDRLDQHNAAEAAKGVLLAADGLRTSARGARVRVAKGSFAVMDGPFTEIKEMIAGYWLIRASSMDEAVAWAIRNPYPSGPRAQVEIRELFEEAYTEEQAQAERNMRATQLDMAMRAELAGRTA